MPSRVPDLEAIIPGTHLISFLKWYSLVIVLRKIGQFHNKYMYMYYNPHLQVDGHSLLMYKLPTWYLKKSETYNTITNKWCMPVIINIKDSQASIEH